MAVENMAHTDMSVNYITSAKKKKPIYDEKQQIKSSHRNVKYAAFLKASTKINIQQ